jgi:hypothetical protein
VKVPVGYALITATTKRATIGRFSGELVNGQLLLTVTTANHSAVEGLAFGVVSFIDDDTGIRVLGDARYYPKPEGTVIALGYGDLAEVSGEVIFEPRGYNLRWIKAEGPGATWGVFVEAETPSGVAVPAYSPTALADGAISLGAQSVTGSNGEDLAQVQWYG